MTIDDKVLDAIRAGVHRNMLICSHTGLDFRKVDPALQRLRRAGKIELRRPEGWFAREATEHAQQFAAARDAVVEAAVRRRIAERAFRGGADPIGRWRAWKDAEVAEDTAVDALLALDPRSPS